ncbi:MAG: flavin reductase family protein [Oscillospiraceae bacterium]|nr:flavin reductase family protein [Oscillospiraceae bacterium]
MSKQSWKGGALLAPVPPVLVSCGTMEEANVMTAAWTGIVNTQPPVTYVSIRPSRYSYDLIQKTGEFVLNLPVKKLVKTIDFCGCRSGREVDKFAKFGLTKEQANHVKAPLIAECPVSLECKVRSVTALGTHDMFLADIVGVNVDEQYLDEQGRLMMEKMELLCYAHGTYFSVGKPLGTFGYSVRKKPLKKKADNSKKRER